MIPFSILDLSPITEGGTDAQSFANTLDIAQHAESWCYQRHSMAEHHGMPAIDSDAPPVWIAHYARGTSPILPAAGGIWLHNNSHLVTDEQYRTLDTLSQVRINLG